MAQLATQSITRAGTEPAYAAAAGGGDTFTPSSRTLIHAKNGSGSAITVTVTTPRTDPLGNAVADNAVAIPAGEERMIGPFPYEHYSDPSTGLAALSYSDVTTLSIAAFGLSQP